MLCKIAELITELPAAGDLVPRCKEYLYTGDESADIVICDDMFRPQAWPKLSGDSYIYMESGSHFYFQLLQHNGIMLHASALELDGKAYLFSGNSGAGKSTHTHMWQTAVSQSARIFNDDKPALRYIDGQWFAYGTPWSGKNGININMKVPVAGICFLKQSKDNRIRRMGEQEALQNIIAQTIHRFKLVENLDLMLQHIERLVKNVPVFELENRPEPEAARLSYESMCNAAKEMGL